VLHRAIHRLSGGRIGLSQPEAGERFGMMRLTTLGRRSGQPRVAIVDYYEDGPNLVTLAMNGWADAQPFMVAEPPGAAGHDGRPGRRLPRHASPRRGRRGARAAVGWLPRLRGESFEVVGTLLPTLTSPDIKGLIPLAMAQHI
jgi:hypothetical protein